MIERLVSLKGLYKRIPIVGLGDGGIGGAPRGCLRLGILILEWNIKGHVNPETIWKAKLVEVLKKWLGALPQNLNGQIWT